MLQQFTHIESTGELEGTGSKCWFDDKQHELKEFLTLIAKTWKENITIPDTYGNVTPSESHFATYLKSIGVKESV